METITKADRQDRRLVCLHVRTLSGTVRPTYRARDARLTHVVSSSGFNLSPDIWMMDMALTRRFSRREVLRIGGVATAAAVLKVTRWSIPASAADAVRSEWTFGEGLPTAGDWESPILVPVSGFDAVDLSWDAAATNDDAVQTSLRVRARDGTWSDWIAGHPDHHGELAADSRRFVAPILSRGVAVQVRVTIADDAGLRELVVGALDTASIAIGGAMTPGDADAQPTLIDGLIISRSGWGADETLRFENKNPSGKMIWPPSYAPIEKIIIHHTVTDNNPLDSLAALRSVYYYHAVTRGWGDIGYNYLVDWQGHIYEGRFGGVNVIGGHSLQYNEGSVGIALLGNFDIAKPPQAMLNAIVSLVELRAARVDVTTSTDFHDLLDCPNLCGHRDVLSTSCPGELCYSLLASIRGTIAGSGPIYLAPPKRTEGVEILSCSIGPTTVYQGNLLEMRMRVKNVGTVTLGTGGPPPGFVYEQGQTFDAAGFPKEQDDYRVTLTADSWSGTPNPYRWGLGAPLASGEQRDIIGYVRLRRLGRDEYRAGVIKEFVAYQYTDVAPTEVTVASPPVGPVAQVHDSDSEFFAITGHNVPEPFISYWYTNGGIERFGYPLTEAFEEVSETDGGRYLTQYFERARFEYHPEYIGTKDEVLLGLLGSETTVARLKEKPFRPIAPFASTSERRFFDLTGHSLSSGFRRFWEANGGLPIFGYPISEEFEEVSETDGTRHVVQYFERNRFEYHADYAGTKDEIMLGHLAREILIRRGWMTRDE